jgi:translocation and assembly module TamB
MRKCLLTVIACFALICGGAVWLTLGGPVPSQREGTILGDLLSRALSTPTSRVSIGSVDGALSADATIRNVVVSDRDGPWLKLDRARLIWRLAGLFSGRLEVDRLELGRLEILRRPASADADRPSSNKPLLPELPLKVEIKAFSLTALELGAPLLGTPERLAVTGAARLGPPTEGLELTLDARRLDAGGRASVRLAFVPEGERFDLRVEHDEPVGGLAARLANLPGLPPVRFEIAGRGVLEDWAATLAGAIGGEALAGIVRLRRPDPDNIALDELDLQLGSARIAGRALLDGAGLAEGAIRIVAPDLDALSPLLLTPLQGQLDGTLTLIRAGGRQGVRLVAAGRGLSAGSGLSLGAFNADVGATDLYGRAVFDGRLTAERLMAGGETFDQVRLSANGTSAASDVELAATARAFQLETRARLVAGEKTRIDLASFTARHGDQRFALAGPASITIDGRSAVFSKLVVTTGGRGRVSLEGAVGERLNLVVVAQALPLSIAEIARPGLGLAGTLAGEAALRGSLARPEGSYRFSVTRLTTPETRGAGLLPIDASASGTLAEDGATLDASASAGPAADLRAAGRVPFERDGPIALKISGQIDAALANAVLSTGGQRLAGRVSLEAELGGTIRVPRIEGVATLAGGAFTDPLQGIRLTGIEGRITGRGDTLTIERLVAATRNGGVLSAGGWVTLDPAAGFPVQIRLHANRAELVANGNVTAVAKLDLTVEGPIMRQPRVAGRVDFVSMDVSIPDRLPTTVRPLAGTRHIAPPSQVQALLTAEQKARARRGQGGAALDAALDLTLSAPNRIFVRGRGVDAELGGDLRLTGFSRVPIAVGAFELRRGRLSVVGQRLDFTRGRLAFTGDLAPELDFIAETRAGNITTRVEVSGPAVQPVFSLTSEPALPQDEVLSRLLFAKASGNLSAFQALQLAEAVAQFSGGSGPDVFDRTRRALGVDSLDITTGASGGPAVGASRYIGNRLSVGVRAGAKPEDSAATATIDVTRRLKVQGGVGADGRSSVGVGAEWEY